MIYSTIKSFKEYLHQVGYGTGTREMLPRLVEEFLEQQRITDIQMVEQEQVKAFYAYLQDRPLKRRIGYLSEMMIAHYVYALKTFFSWLEVTEQIDYNPISGIKFKRARGNSREPISVAEVRELFNAAETLKETAILHLFYSLGLRRSEGEELSTSDVKFKEQLLYVREGKGAKRRVVPMTEPVAKALESYYLNERCNASVKRVKDESAFILNTTGGRMSGDGYNRVLKAITERSGIGKEITLHHLRHSIATHLLQGGMKLEQVRDFLGHTLLETTQIYAKPNPEQLKLL
jgi:integrase/recombinase XerD